MAPLLSEEESALDPYLILELGITANEKDISKAYRKKTLLYHPDKNPTPEAAIKFRELEISLGILRDTAKRTYIDTKLETDRKRKEKYAQSDKKRKDMIDALEQREEDAKKAKVQAAKRRREEAAEEEIKDAGKRMLAEAQKRAAATATAGQAARSTNTNTSTNGHDRSSVQNGSSTNTTTNSNPSRSSQPPISAIDLTLILQFPPSSTLPSSQHTLQSYLVSQYGPINHVFIKDPPAPTSESVGEGSKKKKMKEKGRKAIVEFQEGNWGGCWACCKDCEGGWEGVKVKWAAGGVPDWVAWSETQRHSKGGPTIPNDIPANGAQSTIPVQTTTPTPNSEASRPTFSSAPDFGTTTMSDLLASHNQSRNQELDRKRKEQEFESMTILRMRQMERERLAEEIRLEEEGM